MFKKIIIILITSILAISPSCINVQASSNSPSSWAKEAVEYVFANNLSEPEFNNNYNKAVRREEFAMLAVMLYEGTTGKEFSKADEDVLNDINNTDYKEYILKAYEAGIVKGKGQGKFDPEGLITRQEITLMLFRTIKLIDPSRDYSVIDDVKFNDESNIDSWARESMVYAYKNGIVKGTGSSYGVTISPLANANRETALTLVYRIANSFGYDETNIPSLKDVVSPERPSANLDSSIDVGYGWKASYFIEPGLVKGTSDIDMLPDGTLLINQIRNTNILQIDQDGNMSTYKDMSLDNLIGFYAMGIDSEGNMFGYNSPLGTVFKVDKNKSLTKIVQSDNILAFNESPMAISPTDEVYVGVSSENVGSAFIAKILPSGELEIKSQDLGIGQFIMGMTFDNEGNLYVSNPLDIYKVDLSTGKATEKIARLDMIDGVSNPMDDLTTFSFHGLTIDDSGTFYATADDKVLRISSEGEVTKVADGFSYLEGIYINEDGAIYTVSRDDCAVYKIYDGKIEYLIPPSSLTTSMGLEFNNEGHLFVHEDELGDLAEFDINGEYLNKYEADSFPAPMHEMTFDDSGVLYITEGAPGMNQRVVYFEDSFKSKTLNDDVSYPAGIEYYDGKLYVAEYGANKISIIYPDGSKETYIDNIESPMCIDIDNQGNMYVLSDKGFKHLNLGESFKNELDVVYKIDKDKNITEIASYENVSAMELTNENEILLGHANGLILVSQNGQISTILNTGNNQNISGIAVDTQGRIYATHDKLNAIILIEKQ